MKKKPSTFKQFLEAVDLPPNPPAIVQQHQEQRISGPEIIATLLVREAGGQGLEGMQAVLDVLVNRSKLDGKNLVEEALIFKQFSCLNNVVKNSSGELNKQTIDVPLLQRMIEHSKQTPMFNDAYNLVKQAEQGTLKDITHGATHYHVYRGEKKVSPSWTAIELGGKNPKAVITAKIGDHAFLKGV